MISHLLGHQWKSFWRSRNSGKSVAIRVVMGLLIFYLFLNVLAVAFFLDKILEAAFPNTDLLTAFNRLLLYYFLLDLLFRFQMQELPTLTVQPYLILPVKKTQLVNYLCITSLWSLLNVTPIVLVLPFMLKTVLSDQGGMVVTAILVAIIGLTLFNHFFTLWIKRKSNLNGWYLLAFLLVLGGVCLLDFRWHVISVSVLSELFFGFLANQPLAMFIPLVLAVIMFFINYRYLYNNLYLDELRHNKSATHANVDFPVLGRFGVAGQLAVAELKLITRNKRSKTTLRMCVIMMLYGLIFYTNPAYANGYGWKIFAAQFMTGIFIISYGQFMFSWQSAHFDRILTLEIKPEDFLKSKFILFTLFSGCAFILTTPYVYFGWDILLVQLCMFSWNLGVNTLIVLLFAHHNYKRIDLSKGASFNWEGVGATQLLIGFPLFLLPYFIYAPAALMGYKLTGVVLLGFTGLVFISLRSVFIKYLADLFRKQRYAVAEGFRQQ